MDDEIKWMIIPPALIAFVIWVVITLFQWFVVVNYGPCGDVTWDHSPDWCWFNSRYSLVETIINQWKWVVSLRII